MNFGFDFDKIFIDYPPLIPTSLIDRLYKRTSNNQLSYRIPSKPEQLLRLFTHYPLFRPLIKDNLKFITDISKQKQHKYYLISSRFSFLKNATEALIEKYGLHKLFNDMQFNFENKQPHMFKDEIIKKLKIDRYVDDDLPLLNFIAPRNKKVKFFWFNKNIHKSIKSNLAAITHLKQML